MVFTHLPSNVLTIMIPFMPTMKLASAMVFLSVSQMDDAPRQSFESPDYAAAGGAWPAAFALCGGLKIVYALALLYFFGHVKADVERAQVTPMAEVGELRSGSEDVEAPILEHREDSRLR
ncbi:hypothetical protein WJX75_003759 [Coccomyxa subellipsoidea]|uniref:Uncharacterized protein n=1 Tax=Coccomyxa subellipsoidea TaxID=248742 RepID=A0ABR2YC76_9CHLO